MCCELMWLTRSTADVEPAQMFAVFMELTLKMVENAMDATAYEDALRDLFNIEAYRMYTVDKLSHALVRQVSPLSELS